MSKEPDWYKHLQYSAIGIEMAASVIDGGLIGYGLDWLMITKFGIKTEPWLFISWMIFGIIAGFLALYRMTIKFQKQGKQNEEENEEENNDEGSDRT